MARSAPLESKNEDANGGDSLLNITSKMGTENQYNKPPPLTPLLLFPIPSLY